MEHGEIAGDRIKTSMPISSNTNARLRCSRYSFLGSSQWEPFIQVDLGPENKRLTAFAMQGGDYTYNTWAVYVKYAVGDGSEWFNYTKNGETEVRFTEHCITSRINCSQGVYFHLHICYGVIMLQH